MKKKKKLRMKEGGGVFSGFFPGGFLPGHIFVEPRFLAIFHIIFE